MISKIQMANVASYRAPTTLETDKKVNIIYGLNGTGKSTISNFLYERENSAFGECDVDVAADEKLIVYNQRFIQEYFHEANGLKGVFSLSKENKEIEAKIATAEVELSILEAKAQGIEEVTSAEETNLRDRKTRSTEKTWEIKAQYTGGDRVLEFCLSGLKSNKGALFDFVSNLTKPQSQPERSITEIKKEVEAIHGDAAQPISELALVTFSESEIECSEVFGMAIVGNDDSQIACLINQLGNSDWVRKGLEYLPNPEDGAFEPCPFCQEETIDDILAEKIRSYFDESFESSINLISVHSDRYQSAAEQLVSIDTLREHPLASARISDLADKHREVEKLVSENLELIRSKRASPSTLVTLKSTSVAIEELNAVLTEINQEIKNHNSRLENVEQELAQLKSEFWSLMRWGYDQTISAWRSDEADCNKKIADHKQSQIEADKAIGKKRQEIAYLQKSTVNIETAIENINHSLGQLGINDFSISRHTESLYRIVRSGDTEATFTSLSEGEKMIISFLYFCEICKGKQSADETHHKKILIIDDPISSLSHIFVFNIGQLLKTAFFSSPKYEQVFVLTHSLYFFYELTETDRERRKKNQKLFRLIKNDSGSSIRRMKYEEIQSDYQSYWTIITDKNQPDALIANCMRNIIEYFFNFVHKADFSNVIQMPELQENRFQAFCRYINRESHSLGQNIFDYKEFNYDDFREGLRLVFEVTGYSEHYEKMARALTN